MTNSKDDTKKRLDDTISRLLSNGPNADDAEQDEAKTSEQNTESDSDATKH